MDVNQVKEVASKLADVVLRTPCTVNVNYSKKYEATIAFKREDLQVVRSYKIRGAFNKISSLTDVRREQGVVCASAGNHAQGVALACKMLSVLGTIFMPVTTPSQKVQQVKMFGGNQVEVILVGDTFDDSLEAAVAYCEQNNAVFIHPFDDDKIIEGQATVGLEILEDYQDKIDVLILPIGGGGLAAGVSSMFKQLSPDTQIIGVEPLGAPSMTKALQEKSVTVLDSIEKFIDGASVKVVGQRNFEICRNTVDRMLLVPEGLVCKTMLQLYNEEAMVVEPAGALSIAALELLQNEIKGKNVVCIVSGGNNDISRTEEIRERALLYEQKKHYFIINFPQRAGALREFLMQVLSPTDDIVYFQYMKRNNREKGPALVGIELKEAQDLDLLLVRMRNSGFLEKHLNQTPDLLHFLV